MKLILIRHVETKANAEKKYIGHTKSEYTDNGKKQISKIIEVVKDEKIKKIYSSPLPRALSIAKRLSSEMDKGLEIEPSLIEMNFGIFEGKTYLEAKDEFEKEWKAWTKDYKSYRIPKGESLTDVYNRVARFIDILKPTEETYILVSHGGIIQTIITYLLDLNVDDRWHFKIPPGTIVEIEYNYDYGILTKMITSNV